MRKGTYKRVYLCGSMSNLKDGGATWRASLSTWLHKNGFTIYNPCVEELSVHKKYRSSHTNKSKWELFPQIVQEKIILSDLFQIEERTDFVICYFTKYSCGTVSELTFAFKEQIPIYFVTKLKMIDWPGTISRHPRNKVFRSFAALKKFLKRTCK